MKKILDVPFYINDGDGNQCMQVAIRGVLKYFLHRDISLDELDLFTKRKQGLRTRTPQGVVAMNELGLRVKYFSKSPIEEFLGGEDFIRQHFGDDAEKILYYTDLPVLIESIHILLGLNLFEQKELTVNEMEAYILEGCVLIVLIDANIIVGKHDSFQGHYVTLTGFDDGNFYYHDSGPMNACAGAAVDKELFMNAFNANGTDNDVVVVFAKK